MQELLSSTCAIAVTDILQQDSVLAHSAHQTIDYCSVKRQSSLIQWFGLYDLQLVLLNTKYGM